MEYLTVLVRFEPSGTWYEIWYEFIWFGPRSVFFRPIWYELLIWFGTDFCTDHTFTNRTTEFRKKISHKNFVRKSRTEPDNFVPRTEPNNIVPKSRTTVPNRTGTVIWFRTIIHGSNQGSDQNSDQDSDGD